ncbi:hypothetical protein MMON_46390 [Mycolicibacterium monacense]|uniref:Uncharacterized protein n=1 Tax=Mycolicibacterium monacense TaxID=85693 RepID=A0AAD1MZ85_MYCMB|nr:hypothetical protein MMON_46390 [Mycolicibacterium monacense]
MLGGSIAPTGGALSRANSSANKITPTRCTAFSTPRFDPPTASRLSVDSKPPSASREARSIPPCGPVECTEQA